MEIDLDNPIVCLGILSLAVGSVILGAWGLAELLFG